MSPDEAFALYRNQVRAIAITFPPRLPTLQTDPVGADVVIGLISAYIGIADALDTAKNTPGVAAYALNVTTQSANYDLVGEYNAIRGAVSTAMAHIGSFYPQPGGFCADTVMDPTTLKRTYRQFTRAQAGAQLDQMVADAQAVANLCAASPLR